MSMQIWGARSWAWTLLVVSIPIQVECFQLSSSVHDCVGTSRSQQREFGRGLCVTSPAFSLAAHARGLAPRVCACKLRMSSASDSVRDQNTSEGGGESGPVPAGSDKIGDLKRELLVALASCDRGFKATPKDATTIQEIVGRLESVNPTPDPNTRQDLLDGSYQLLFTNASNVLDIAKAPGVQPQALIQQISSKGEVITTVNLRVPAADLEVTIAAQGRLVGNARIAIKFNQISVQPASLLGSRAGGTLPPLRIPMQPPEFLSSFASGDSDEFILHTYLDEELRIARRGKPGDIDKDSFDNDLFISWREG